MDLSHEHIESKISAKMKKSLSSVEPNYFAHLAMRYPVVHNWTNIYKKSLFESLEIFKCLENIKVTRATML